jgi:hypothetical protein
MLAWLLYAVRLLASVVMLFVTVTFLIIAAVDPKTRWLLLGMAGLFGVAGAFAWPRRPNAWRHDPPTDRQVAFARDLGISIPRKITKGELSDLISQAKQVRDAL